MLQGIIQTLQKIISEQGVVVQEDAMRPLKHTAVSTQVYGSDKVVKVGYLLSKIIDGLVELPAASIKPTYEEMTKNGFDANAYAKNAQAVLEQNVLEAEMKVSGKIIPTIVAEDHSAGTITVPYIHAASFREGIQTRCMREFGAPLNDATLNSIAKTCSYLSTPVYAEQTFKRTVMVVPNDWLLHNSMMDGVGYVRAKGASYLNHPRCGEVRDNDVCQVRGLVNVPEDGGAKLYLYKGTLAPIHLSQMGGVFKREYIDAVNEALDKGYVVVTADTVKKAPVGTYETCFYLHDSSVTEQWTNLRSLSLQAAMKLCWQDISGCEGKIFQHALEYCAALDNDRALVEDIAGKIEELDENSELPTEELSAALDQVRLAGLAPYDRINLTSLLAKIMTTKRIKQIAEIKEKGMRLYVVANNEVPRNCVRIGKSNYWRMKSMWKSEMAIVARAPYSTTSVNVCRVLCGDHDAPVVEINPMDAPMFSADFDGDKMTLTECHEGVSFVSLGQVIDDLPLPASISKASLSKFCPLIPAQYGTQNETAAILYALSVGNRIDIGDAVVLGLISMFEERGMSALDARRCAYEVERNLFEALIDCRKHVDSSSMIPNLAAISLIQMRDKLYTPRLYRLLSGKLEFSDISIADLPKAIREELEDAPITKNAILEEARGYLLDFLPEKCSYAFGRVNCDRAKALIREIISEYGDIVKELQFSVKDGKAMTIENVVLDRYLTYCKNKQFDEAARYMDDVIEPWTVNLTKDGGERSVIVWFILSAFAVKNRASAGHMRFGFILRHVPAIILRTVVDMTYAQVEIVEHEHHADVRKREMPKLAIFSR